MQRTILLMMLSLAVAAAPGNAADAPAAKAEVVQ